MMTTALSLTTMATTRSTRSDPSKAAGIESGTEEKKDHNKKNKEIKKIAVILPRNEQKNLSPHETKKQSKTTQTVTVGS